MGLGPKERNMIPVVEGVFTIAPEEVSLIGAKCAECGAVAFPKTVIRHRTGCKDGKTSPIRLSQKGKVRSYTIQHFPPPPIFHAPQPFQPYVIASVEFEEGIEIAGILTGWEEETIPLGMPVEVTSYKLYEDEQGNDVVTYGFRPTGNI